MISEKEFLLVYPNIFFVKGYTQTLVLDLSKKSWIYLDNDYTDIVNSLKKSSIKEVADTIDPSSRDEFSSFIMFLLEHDYATYVDDLSLFPEIEETWISPYEITNSIIDFDAKFHDMQKISNELYLLGCQYIELRFYSDISLNKIEYILSCLKEKDFRNIHFIIKYDTSFSRDALSDIHKKFLNCSFTIYNSPINKFYESELNNVLPSVGYVNYISQPISSCMSCGIINSTTLLHPKDVGSFMENKLFNSCINRKISIDVEGNIKNCPSMKQIYGNIDSDSLVKSSRNALLQEKWMINKDLIKVCSDCEYRYVCSDCRAYIEHPEDEYSKPLKCGYDPYTGEWTEWSLNPLKQNAIKFYGMLGLVNK
ncbi:grasp-with-spasm system SPASM domain peptide maturase [Chryseobacterium sp. SIMBA_029]|uniref:grasp-with-spasm system SPASM domain peptide maturase n=1 Tax=Chryseobacterium sp. SIMBA_029 TaxID=3085772 RepID=UPI00397E84F7